MKRTLLLALRPSEPNFDPDCSPGPVLSIRLVIMLLLSLLGTDMGFEVAIFPPL